LWRCHRRIIADHLLAAGETVRHIMDAGIDEAHLTPAAQVHADGTVSYPAPQRSLNPKPHETGTPWVQARRACRTAGTRCAHRRALGLAAAHPFACLAGASARRMNSSCTVRQMRDSAASGTWFSNPWNPPPHT
jgi:hypothetical protein